MLSFIELIKQRRSIRNYTGEPLKEKDRKQILKYIAGLKAPWNATVRIELVSGNTGDQPVKLGTYGMISGATDFLVLIYEDSPMGDEGAGYLFEKVILYCTGLGLGTCWLGGTFKKSDFAKQVDLQPGEILRIVSPVGYIKPEKRLMHRLFGNYNHKSRKMFEDNFYDGYFTKQLSIDNAGVYYEPLEMSRLAPSANNRQPWRIVINSGLAHFYYRAGKFSRIEMGIIACHFELTCRELKVSGDWQILERIKRTISVSNNLYDFTWVRLDDVPLFQYNFRS